jgi:hypothetical protein
MECDSNRIRRPGSSKLKSKKTMKYYNYGKKKNGTLKWIVRIKRVCRTTLSHQNLMGVLQTLQMMKKFYIAKQ